MPDDRAGKTVNYGTTTQIEYQGVIYMIEAEQSTTATETPYTKLKRLILRHMNDDTENV